MNDYYSRKLSADRLRRVYDLAPPRIRQYLQAEIDFVSRYINSDDTVLELGCGYGRVLRELAIKARPLVGIDSSIASIQAAKNICRASPI